MFVCVRDKEEVLSNSDFVSVFEEWNILKLLFRSACPCYLETWNHFHALKAKKTLRLNLCAEAP